MYPQRSASPLPPSPRSRLYNFICSLDRAHALAGAINNTDCLAAWLHVLRGNNAQDGEDATPGIALHVQILGYHVLFNWTTSVASAVTLYMTSISSSQCTCTLTQYTTDFMWRKNMRFSGFPLCAPGLGRRVQWPRVSISSSTAIIPQDSLPCAHAKVSVRGVGLQNMASSTPSG